MVQNGSSPLNVSHQEPDTLKVLCVEDGQFARKGLFNAQYHLVIAILYTDQPVVITHICMCYSCERLVAARESTLI